MNYSINKLPYLSLNQDSTLQKPMLPHPSNFYRIPYHDEQIRLVCLLSNQQEEEAGGGETCAHGRHGHPQVLLVLQRGEITVSRNRSGG